MNMGNSENLKYMKQREIENIKNIGESKNKGDRENKKM